MTDPAERRKSLAFILCETKYLLMPTSDHRGPDACPHCTRLVAEHDAAVYARAISDAVNAVAVEEELDGRMPDQINTALSFGPREARAAILRNVVRNTKQSITTRLAALPATPSREGA